MVLSNREESFKTDRLLNSYLSQVCRKPKTEKLCLSCVFFLCVVIDTKPNCNTYSAGAHTQGGKILLDIDYC